MENVFRKVTEAQLNGFVTSAGFRAERVEVSQDMMSGQAGRFGSIQLGEIKDFDRAIAGLISRAPDGRNLSARQVRLVRVGHGEGPKRERVEAVICTADLGDRVRGKHES